MVYYNWNYGWSLAWPIHIKVISSPTGLIEGSTGLASKQASLVIQETEWYNNSLSLSASLFCSFLSASDKSMVHSLLTSTCALQTWCNQADTQMKLKFPLDFISLCEFWKRNGLIFTTISDKQNLGLMHLFRHIRQSWSPAPVQGHIRQSWSPAPVQGHIRQSWSHAPVQEHIR